jgi:energy-coupling factor transporter ATP-binding protein EcfA2
LSAIEIADLHYAYPPLWAGSASIEVLRGVSLSIERGEFLALMGPTGVGKSTLLMALNGIVPQSTGGIIRGRVTVLGADTRRTPVAELARRVGIVYQDAESQVFSTTVEDEVAFGPENLGVAPPEIAERVAWALDVVDMRAHGGRAPAQLSGGQKQRVAIAATLAMLPEVLILDEPTAALDPLGQREVLAVVERLCRERRATIIMASHHAEQVAEFADRVAVMVEGRIVRVDEPLRVFEDADLLADAGLAAPQVTEVAQGLNRRLGTRYSFATLDAAAEALGEGLAGSGWRASGPTGSRSPAPGCSGAPPPSPSMRSEGALTPSPRLRGEGRGEGSSPHTPEEGRGEGPPPSPRVRREGWGEGSSTTRARGEAPPSIRIEGLTYQYDEISPALNGIDLTIADNAYLAIIGQNGSGKTTLVKHLNGLLRPTGGRVWVEGIDTRTASVGQLARRVGYVFQNPDHQIFGATVREEIGFGPRSLGLSAAAIRERTDEALAAFDLAAYAEAPPAVLGYGLRRKVSLAAVFAMRPHILILDEPTAGLDARSTADLMARVDAMHHAGHTIILVTHDMRLAAAHCHEVLVMHEGRALAYGPTQEVFCRLEDLEHAQLAPPQAARLARRLTPQGMPCTVLTAAEFVAAYAALGVASHRGSP